MSSQLGAGEGGCLGRGCCASRSQRAPAAEDAAGQGQEAGGGLQALLAGRQWGEVQVPWEVVTASKGKREGAGQEERGKRESLGRLSSESEVLRPRALCEFITSY